MSEFENYNRILLVRAEPGSAPARAALAAAGRDTPAHRVLVFFHSRGVGHAVGAVADEWRMLAAHYGVRLEVCSTAWSRRHDALPPTPFEMSTLARFWHRAVQADRVACFGAANES